MTIVAIRCPGCRTTDDVAAPALLVDVDAAADSAAASVTWICATCDELVAVPVEWAALLAVVSAGAVLVADAEDVEPARAAHPESHAGGARLTPDDLLDFHQGLDAGDWLEELCSPVELQPGGGPA